MYKIDLLLINAPSRMAVYGPLTAFAAIEPPVWALLIAQRAKRDGFSVVVLDAEAEGLDAEQAAASAVSIDARLTVFCIYGQQPSASTQCMPAAQHVARVMLAAKPTLVTVALGTHPSALPRETLREGPFAFVLEGDGVDGVLALLRDEPLSVIPGLHYSAVSGEYNRNQPPHLVDDLDAALPGQAFGELPALSLYRAHNWHRWTATRVSNGYASVQTSLGCPFRCSFCCINAPFGQAGIRFWSPQLVVAQIAALVKNGVTDIKIPDEMFLLNRAHVEEICNGLLAGGFGGELNMWAYARVDTLGDERLLQKMRRAGFRWLGVGIESGSAHVRAGVDKGKFTDERIAEAIKRASDSGICIAANYIFGLPDDTETSMQRTLDMACELNTSWANFYCAMAYPGSALHETVRQLDHSVWPLPEYYPDVGWIGYSQHAYETYPLRTATLSQAQVLSFRDCAFMTYFGRPAYQNALLRSFGIGAFSEVTRMLQVGRPKRMLLEN